MRRLLLIAGCLLLALAGRAQELDSLQRAGLDSRLDAFFAALENESIPAKKAEADFLVGSCTTDAVRDYVAVRIYDHYLNSKRMGDEAVAVHMTDAWFAPGKAHFSNEIDLMDAKIFAEFNRATLLGEMAPALTARDPEDQVLTLFGGGSSRYRILYFYDTGCVTCKVETMQLRAAFAQEDFPVDFIAFYTGDDAATWETYRTEQLRFKAPSIRMVHAWDPTFESDFQLLYGVLQTPRVFLVGKDGTILGRGLDAEALLQMLRSLFPKMTYGSEESVRLYDQVFSALEPGVTAGDVRAVADHVGDITLGERDTLLYKQMTGDLLQYLSGKRGEGYKEGLAYVTDSLILEKPAVWNMPDDTLQVISLARVMKDLLDRTPVGSRLPKIRVPGTLYKAGGSRPARRSLRSLKRTYLFFYSAGCCTCEADRSALPAALAADPRRKAFLVDQDSLMASDPDLAERLLDTFDLSSLPLILETDRSGRIIRRYLSLQQ